MQLDVTPYSLVTPGALPLALVTPGVAHTHQGDLTAHLRGLDLNLKCQGNSSETMKLSKLDNTTTWHI